MAIEKKIKEQDATPQETKTEATSASNAIPEKEESMPVSLVQKLMHEMEEKLSNKFRNQIDKLKLHKAKSELDEDVEYVEGLEDDWLDVPITFFAFSMRYSIHSDRRKGQEVLPPFGEPIKFKPLIRHKRPGRGKEVEVVSVSSVSIQSKKVVDYLRGHSLFGIYFYENMENAMNVDSSWAHKMVEAQRSLSRLSDMQIVARAKQEGLSVSQSPERMRRELSEILAKKAQDQHERILNQRLRDSVVDGKGRSVTEGKIS
jgi:hypothetical protein